MEPEIIHRCLILNELAQRYLYQSYLELGVADFQTFHNVIVPNKECVDSQVKDATYFMTTDEFFKNVPADKTWDLIFIDALHEYSQVKKDFWNSLAHLAPNGTIVLHDTCPLTPEMEQIGSSGNVWKLVFELRCMIVNLDIKTVFTDCGVTVIRRGTQELFNSFLNFEFLDKHRKELLNLVSSQDFKQGLMKVH